GARFEIPGEPEPLITARRRGERLEWIGSEQWAAMKESDRWDIHHSAPATFALALALRGWPLIRSGEHWAKRPGWSDMGEPEGLAYKIEIFEAIDRREGFQVRCPVIPGLGYREYDDID